MDSLVRIGGVVGPIFCNLLLLFYLPWLSHRVKRLGRRVSGQYRYHPVYLALPGLTALVFVLILLITNWNSEEPFVYIYRVGMLCLVFIVAPLVFVATRRFVGIYESGLYVGLSAVKFADIDLVSNGKKVITKKRGNIGNLVHPSEDEILYLKQKGVRWE